MKILYLLKHNPWGKGGGCFACRAYMEAFLHIFNNAEFTFIICSEYLSNMQKTNISPRISYIGVNQRNIFSRILMPLTGILCRHFETAKKTLYGNEFDYVIFDHSYLAGSLIKYAKRKKCKTITLHHNYEMDYFKDNHSKLLYTLMSRQIEVNERTSYYYSNYNIFLTSQDLSCFINHYGNTIANNHVIGSFEFKKIQYLDKPIPLDRIVIAITGSIGNVQNMDGLNDFITNYYKEIDINKYSIIIAGRNAPYEFIEKCKKIPNISIINNPDSMDEILSQSSIFLCTTKLGSGIKIRLMDGLRHGKPVITHINSSKGYEIFTKEGYMLTYSNPKEFSSCLLKISKLIMNDKNAVSKKIFDLYINNFSFDSGIKRLRTMLDINQ